MKSLITQKFPYLLFTIFLLMEIGVFLSHKIVSMHATGDGFAFYLTLLSQPWIWVSLVLALIQFFLWTAVLAKSELSLAYSMSSLSYPLTMLVAAFLFKEHLSLLVWSGGGLITLGVIIVGLETE
ncbi:MAG: hypothetical protein A2039_02360 [Candidatus Melainabacteria bacterium GWA2_34_9]|nr:MAG: hypothetical protein A2039_02360 [Candidatus Melainabacteria bacterium GWA2_34_9]